MKCLVMKFGGTSLGNEERIKSVSEKIIKNNRTNQESSKQTHTK